MFTTHEAIELEGVLSVDKAGALQPFVPDLLLKELMQALSHRKDVYAASEEVLSTTVRKLLTLPQKPVFSPIDISKTTAEVLRRFDKRAYLRFAAEHPSLHKKFTP